jgi:hypothetical protein
VGSDETAQHLRSDANADTDKQEQKDGEVILEVHREAFVERSVDKTLLGSSTASRNPGFVPTTRITRPKILVVSQDLWRSS